MQILFYKIKKLDTTEVSVNIFFQIFILFTFSVLQNDTQHNDIQHNGTA
jgi:hypothetical protein